MTVEQYGTCKIIISYRTVSYTDVYSLGFISLLITLRKLCNIECSVFSFSSILSSRFMRKCAFYYPPFASIAKGEVFVLLYVFLFVWLTISQQPAGRFTPYFACGRSLGRDVSSPLLVVGGPRLAEKEANEIFVTMESMGNFLHFGGF